jgi:anaerobic selenocysteine-containing dehydrogenase
VAVRRGNDTVDSPMHDGPMHDGPVSTEAVRSEKTFCRVCVVTCGLVVDVEIDGGAERVVRIRGDEAHPVTKGYSCAKGRALDQMHHHPDALQRPMIRQGDTFVEASWDACLDDVASRLQRVIDRIGPNGVGIFYGTGSGMDAAAFTAAERLQRKIGTKQRYTQLTIDGVAKPLVAELVGGFVGLNPRVDLDEVKLLVYVGINPVVSHGHTIATPEPVTFLRRLQDDAEVWVVDPRRSETAQHATGHLAARAGTDFAIFAYVARELLRQGIDAAYVAEWAIDVDRLREVVEPFTVGLASEITGLPAAELEAFLAAVRRAGRVAIETGTGVSMSKAANVTQWLTWVVMILTGSMNRPGGVWFHPGFVDRLDTFELPISPPEGRRGPGPDSRPDLHRYLGDYPCAGLPDEINAGNVAAFLNLGGNMVASFPDTTHLVPALRRLEAFVSLDILAGDTTELSTHVLPVKDQLERADVTIWDFISRHLDVQYTPPVLAPTGERRSMWWVLTEIGRRLGHDLFPELGPSPTDDDILALRISNARVGFDELAPARYAQRDEERDDAWVDAHIRRLGGWRLAPQILVEQLAALGRLETGSLVLVPRRQRRHLNAQLRYLGDRPEILVHPEDARDNGIEDGGDVRVRSVHGEIRGPVRIDESVGRGHVSVPHGWGDTNVNVLTSKDDVDPITGMPLYSGLEVTLSDGR